MGAPTIGAPERSDLDQYSETTSIKTDMNVKTVTGRGSGETFQIAFGGQGWALVQPSEGRRHRAGLKAAAGERSWGRRA